VRAKTTGDREEADGPTGTDSTIMSMDVNCDSLVESQITLVGLITLGQGDFNFGGPRGWEG
jgi:hypothetical protein